MLLSYARMDTQLPETVAPRDCQVVIRNAHMQHYALKQFTTPAFLAVKMDDWHLNMDGGLPLHTDLVVLADGPHGPILLEHGNSLHLAVAVNSSFACESTKLIIRKYMSRTLQRVAENSTHSMRLYEFLFTMHPAGLTEANKLSKHMAPPLNSLSVRSTLPGGPTRHVADTDKAKANSPTARMDPVPPLLPLKKGRPQKPPVVMTRNPCQSREMRLRRVFLKCYGDDSANKFCDGVGTSNTIGIPVPQGMDLQDTTDQQRQALEEYRQAVSPISRPHSQSPSRRNLHDSDEHFDASKSRTQRCVSARDAQNATGNILEIASEGRPHTSRPVSREEGMRVNWETNWQEVRLPSAPVPHPPPKPPQLTLPVNKAVAACYLPIQHPRSATSHLSLGGCDSDRGAVESERSGSEVRIEKVRPRSSKPYSTKSSFDQIVAQEKTRKEYLGVFRGGYLTPYERDRKDYAERREKFIAGTFKTHHGKASEIPLRQEGGVRAHGAFPAPITYHKDNTFKLHGDWTPTTYLNPKHQEDLMSAAMKRATTRGPSSSKTHNPSNPRE